MKEPSDVQIVKAIIEQELENLANEGVEDPKVSKVFVVETIKVKVHYTRLRNKVYTYSQNRSDGATSDARRNIHLGAQKVYRDSIRGLRNLFVVKDGWIKRRPRTSSAGLIEFRGQSKTVSEWAGELGIDESTLRRRLGYGWSVERALTERVHVKGDSVRNTLLQLITTKWMSRDELKKKLLSELDKDDDYYFNVGISQIEAEIKQMLKKNPHYTERNPSRERAIKRGKTTIISDRLSRLKRDGLIEIDNKLVRLAQK